MGSRQKYRELSIGPACLIGARASTVGLIVVADYNDPVSNQRTLLLKRVGKPSPVDPTPGKRKKKAVNGADDSANKSLAFPGEAAASA